MPLVSLESTTGLCWFDLSQVALISAPFVKGKLAPSRRLGLANGLIVFVLDNQANYDVLRSLLPDDAPAYVPYQEPEKPAKAPKAKKPRQSRWGTQKPSTTTEGPFIQPSGEAKEKP